MMPDLALVAAYFEAPFNTLYEDDLVRHFGRDGVDAAIRDGSLCRRSVPCIKGGLRCVCWPTSRVNNP